ncbi:hypothetical protein WMF27_40515 [Sorangium sp. So ce281]|uniref:hypothetical protein n=1 Tax=unclassified Sorangium TaxID=2621164 RepID=UPI003F5E8115
MKKWTMSLLGTAAFALLTTGAAIGYSDTLPAMAGHAWSAADAGCFSSSWSAVSNTCGSTKKLLVPVQSRANGSVNFRATPTTSSGGPLCIATPTCRAVVTSLSNGFVAQSGATLICSSASPPATVSLGTLTVSSTSVAHYDCDFPAASTAIGSFTF